MINKFRGTGVALVTPFLNGEVDFNGLNSLIEFLIEGGVEFLVSLGTTGESATLSKEEKIRILDFTSKAVAGRVSLVAGFGGNCTADVCESINQYHFNGYDAILSVSPAYNKPTQEGIFQHFMMIEKCAPLPIIIYNVPSRTGSNIEAKTVLRLAQASEKFIGVKEASGDLAQAMEISKYKPDNFLLLSGDDLLTLPMLSFGGDGVISVIANGFPRKFSDMVRAGLQGDFDLAKNLHLQLLELMHLIFVDGNPAGIKGVLKILDRGNTEVRLPLVALTDPTYKAIRKAMHELEVVRS